MWKGEVVSVHIAHEAEQPMQTFEEILAVAGKGIEGDRYFKGEPRTSTGRAYGLKRVWLFFQEQGAASPSDALRERGSGNLEAG